MVKTVKKLAMIDMMNVFSENLKRLLRERGLSIKELSKRTTIPSSSITEWVNSSRAPKFTPALLALCKCLDTTLEALLSEPSAAAESQKTPERDEASLLKELIQNPASRFVSVHSGVYRLNVEKLVVEGDEEKKT